MSDPKKPGLLPPPVAALLARVQAWFGRLSRPARILYGSTLALTAICVTYLGYQETHEPYAVLFSQLDQEDAAAIVAKLKEQKTPFTIAAGGSTVLVPESRVGEARLELASAGMPRGGGVGFESFDKMRLGATEFEQRVLYRRALEGELSRTIGTLGAVQSARVHLVLPEKSVFVSRADPASSSVVLKLRAGRSIGSSEISGIVHLVAASVPGLTADHIALVTTEGEMLKKPRAGEGAPGSGDEEEQGALAHNVESQLEDRARAMLEKVVGPGHVDVRVTAEIDSASVEHTEDHYDPSRTALRSEESSKERSGPGIDDSVAGVPGAESNLPTGGAPAAAPPAASSAASAVAKLGDGGAPRVPVPALARNADPMRESHTRNFEVDHVSEKRTIRPGTVKRITAAVVLDGVPRTVDGVRIIAPREREELDKLSALVRSAVGANEARGDVVTVDSVPFQEALAANEAPPVSPAPPAPPWKAYLRYAPVAGGGVALLGAALAVLLLRARRNRKSVAMERSAVLSMPEGADGVQLTAVPSPEALRAEAHARAAKDPATAALVVRLWLGTREEDSRALGA